MSGTSGSVFSGMVKSISSRTHTGNTPKRSSSRDYRASSGGLAMAEASSYSQRHSSDSLNQTQVESTPRVGQTKRGAAAKVPLVDEDSEVSRIEQARLARKKAAQRVREQRASPSPGLARAPNQDGHTAPSPPPLHPNPQLPPNATTPRPRDPSPYLTREGEAPLSKSAGDVPHRHQLMQLEALERKVMELEARRREWPKIESPIANRFVSPSKRSPGSSRSPSATRARPATGASPRSVSEKANIGNSHDPLSPGAQEQQRVEDAIRRANNAVRKAVQGGKMEHDGDEVDGTGNGLGEEVLMLSAPVDGNGHGSGERCELEGDKVETTASTAPEITDAPRTDVGNSGQGETWPDDVHKVGEDHDDAYVLECASRDSLAEQDDGSVGEPIPHPKCSNASTANPPQENHPQDYGESTSDRDGALSVGSAQSKPVGLFSEFMRRPRGLLVFERQQRIRANMILYKSPFTYLPLPRGCSAPLDEKNVRLLPVEWGIGPIRRMRTSRVRALRWGGRPSLEEPCGSYLIAKDGQVCGCQHLAKDRGTLFNIKVYMPTVVAQRGKTSKEGRMAQHYKKLLRRMTRKYLTSLQPPFHLDR